MDILLVIIILLNLMATFVFSAVSPKPDINEPIAYWVNIETSTSRRVHMEEMLDKWKMPHSRVKAYTPSDIVVGKHLLNYSYCEIQSVPDLYAPRKGYQGPFPPHVKTTIRVLELCGRPRNLLKELAGTIGHLMAIHKAVYAPFKSPYALIMEDDVSFGFKVNFTALALTAPKDFLVLQLLTSNDNRVEQMWEQYKKNPRDMWIGRRIRGPHHMDFWCAGAYIIHRERFKPLLDRIFNVHPNGTIDLRIIAAYHRPCYPIGCCDEDNWKPPKKPPCIYSPRGFGADDFIYALGPTYVLRVPVVGGAGVGNTSTIHQYEVKRHVNAFRLIEGYMQEMRSASTSDSNGKGKGKVVGKLPHFASIS
eukprot:gene11470-23988_t